MKNATCKRGLIFDMDGTLWDSSENVAVSWNLAIQKSGMIEKMLTAEDIKSVMGRTMDDIADILFAKLPEKERMQLLEQCCRMENDYLREHGGILYKDVKETLGRLRERFDLFIVSNCQAGYIEAFLDHYRMWEYFSDIECYGNNLLQKGDNIRLVADRNRLQQAVYIGDIQGDYTAAKAAGVGFIHAAYGFGTIDEEVPAISCFGELLADKLQMGEWSCYDKIR